MIVYAPQLSIMVRARTIIKKLIASEHLRLPITHDYKLTIMKQSRMAFLLIKLVTIENNSSLMHREYPEFYAVHVYLRSIHISLGGSEEGGNWASYDFWCPVAPNKISL